MKKTGYTLIELLLSAAIFAGVLMLSFTLVATINRLSRRSEDARQIVFNTSTLMDRLVEYVRSASPLRTEHDRLVCPASSSDNIQLAGRNGVRRVDGNSLLVNLRQSNRAGIVSYKTYYFYLESAGLSAVPIGTTWYNLYRPKLTVINLNSDCSYDGSQDLSYLLPTNELALVAAGSDVFTVNPGPVTNGGPVGDLTLNPTDIDEVPSQLVTINLTFVKQEEIQANPESASKYAYLTSVSPRAYQVTFVKSSP